MTMQEFANECAYELFNNNTEAYFEKLKTRIDKLSIDSKPIKLNQKIQIWKLIEDKYRELFLEKTKHIYENENQGLLTLISSTIRSLESAKEE